MKRRLLILLPLLVLAAQGCDTISKESSAASAPDAPPSAPATAASTPASAPTSAPAASPTVAKTTPPPTTAKTPAKPAAKTATNSTSTGLDHEGYAYSGLSNTKPVDMELTTSTEPGKVTSGSQSVTLKETKDGKAVYTIDRTGGLAIMGTEEWTVTKDGVYTTKSSMMDVGDKAMELPANPKVGMTWKVHTKSSNPATPMDLTVTFKILGKESVTTKLGSYKDALVVEQDGDGSIKSQKVRTESKNWYVKGIGLVKATVTNHLADGSKQSLLIQVTKS